MEQETGEHKNTMYSESIQVSITDLDFCSKMSG